jgi:3-phenylpropionate/trans-cinnamate dioxygenase ferredoxin reductase component
LAGHRADGGARSGKRPTADSIERTAPRVFNLASRLIDCEVARRATITAQTRPACGAPGGQDDFQTLEGSIVGRIVIIGAGHAGGTAAALLRQYGSQDEIVMIGEETLPPYQRPPLSKAYLKGEVGMEHLLLKGRSFYVDQGIQLELGRRVTRVDPSARLVELGAGAPLEYDNLIVATGSRARPLPVPGASLAGVLAVRNLADVDVLKGYLRPESRLVVIGGGYIGLEVAASARGFGATVTILERETRCLARVACGPLGTFFERYHTARGVNIVTGVTVNGLRAAEDQPRHVGAAVLTDGRAFAADVVIVGVGAVPCDELARAAGLACENGIVVDEKALTSAPGIYAVGDVTWRKMPHYDDRRFRLESVPNAIEQAKQAASAITGRPPPTPEVPWFWSDQYDLKLQIAGVPFGAAEQIVRGDPDAARFAVFHLEGTRVLAVEAVNAAPEFMVGKQLIASRRPVLRERLTDMSVPVKALAG